MLTYAHSSTSNVLWFAFISSNDLNNLLPNDSSMLEAHIFTWIGVTSVALVLLFTLVLRMLDRRSGDSMKFSSIQDELPHDKG
ncbi:hypothetical protein XM38_004530 [Halomicronema hongdechloris C2206]|uniref:Uncharacterized protein n=1 Tax=Halomicronema hongdechloris C2206 TaxID=1641165 RepID=A0A1Z3HGW0_9CYAN|nr:hypothetical protein XM38_004530 [Halomicronema hongdechloris C2206]